MHDRDAPAALEVEMKFAVPNFDQVLQSSLLQNVAFRPVQRQSDRYFNHPQRDFAQTDEALRVRCVEGQCCITFKGPKRAHATKTRQDIEVDLVPGVQFGEQLAQILLALGFRPVAEVVKERFTAQLIWEDVAFELAFDTVQEVGTFVEVETLADEAALSARQASLLRLASELGLEQSERRSYLEMLLERRRV
jgi:adenylate cyclase class 2